MSKITEKILEPGKIYVSSSFKLKIKVEDTSKNKKIVVAENSATIKTEDDKKIKTEWSD